VNAAHSCEDIHEYVASVEDDLPSEFTPEGNPVPQRPRLHDYSMCGWIFTEQCVPMVVWGPRLLLWLFITARQVVWLFSRMARTSQGSSLSHNQQVQQALLSFVLKLQCVFMVRAPARFL
jgi:hypothetical protein